MAAASSFPDVWTWIQSLPPITQMGTNPMSITICYLGSSQPSLKLSIAKNHQSSSFSFFILADYSLPISLWTSKPFKPNSRSTKLLDEGTISNLLINFIEDVLKFSPNKNTSLMPKFPQVNSATNLKDVFNFSFLTLTFLVCIYEAPTDLRCECLNTLKNQLACFRKREVTTALMKLLGSNTEEQWMRSINLALTNWIEELRASNHTLKTPSPLFSYAFSAAGLWKVQLYCPVIAMDVTKSSNPPADERLRFSLNYHELEGVIQLNYNVMVRERWVEVMVNTDNIRFNVIQLVNETLMNERGAGTAEKHFPSRIALQLSPIVQTNVISVSVSKSSENPTREVGFGKTIEGSLDSQSFLALRVSAGETTTMSLKPWKFEQSVYGDSANLNWFLHDSEDGREVFSSKPSRFAMLQPKAWFKHRYSNVNRPFTRQGGIIFANDAYGESVCWKLDKAATGKAMEWEIKGWIWLTYWPNHYRTCYTETRRLEFREILHLNLA